MNWEQNMKQTGNLAIENLKYFNTLKKKVQISLSQNIFKQYVFII